MLVSIVACKVGRVAGDAIIPGLDDVRKHEKVSIYLKNKGTSSSLCSEREGMCEETSGRYKITVTRRIRPQEGQDPRAG